MSLSPEEQDSVMRHFPVYKPQYYPSCKEPPVCEVRCCQILSTLNQGWVLPSGVLLLKWETMLWSANAQLKCKENKAQHPPRDPKGKLCVVLALCLPMCCREKPREENITLSHFLLGTSARQCGPEVTSQHEKWFLHSFWVKGLKASFSQDKHF